MSHIVYWTTSETKVELQDGVSAIFTRVGNIVICVIVGSYDSSTPLGIVYDGVVPNGYRPQDNNRLAPWVDSYSHVGRFGPYRNSNFVVYGSSGGVVQGTIVGVSTYITDDPMPS